MREIKVQPLSREAFARYGEYQDLLDDASLKEHSLFPRGFFADVIKLDFATTTLPTISVCQVQKQEEWKIAMLEAHQYTCEGLLPLDDDVVIFVGAPLPAQPFSSSELEAFYVPKGTFVKLNPLVIHGTQFPVQADNAHIVCMLPGRTFRNDMLAERLNEEEQIRILR